MSRRVSPDSEDGFDGEEGEGGPSTFAHTTQSGGDIAGGRRKKPRMSLEETFTKQSTEEKQKLGRGYRDLQDKAEGLKSDLANTTANDLRRQLKEGVRLFANVKDTGIAAIDARHFATTLDAAMSVARRMNLDSNQFNIEDFLHRMRDILGLDRAELHDMDGSEEEEEDELDESAGQGRVGRESRVGRRGARKGVLGDWEKVGWMAMPYCRRVPGFEMMLGPLETDYKKRNVARRAPKAPLAPVKRAQEIETSTQKDKAADDTPTNVRTTYKILRKLDPDRQGISIFKLIINPDDYGQTVENLFYLSFLIKDGRVAVNVEEDGEIIIRETDPGEDYDAQPKRQEVVELDMEVWRDAIALYNIKKSEMPHRDYSNIGQVANGWK